MIPRSAEPALKALAGQFPAVILLGPRTVKRSAFYFYRTHSGAEIDLLIDRGSRRVGFEFNTGVATDADDWKHLQAGIDDGVIHRGYVVYNGVREFPVSDEIYVIPAAQLLSGKLGMEWMKE